MEANGELCFNRVCLFSNHLMSRRMTRNNLYQVTQYDTELNKHHFLQVFVLKLLSQSCWTDPIDINHTVMWSQNIQSWIDNILLYSKSLLGRRMSVGCNGLCMKGRETSTCLQSALDHTQSCPADSNLEKKHENWPGPVDFLRGSNHKAYVNSNSKLIQLIYYFSLFPSLFKNKAKSYMYVLPVCTIKNIHFHSICLVFSPFQKVQRNHSGHSVHSTHPCYINFSQYHGSFSRSCVWFWRNLCPHGNDWVRNHEQYLWDKRGWFLFNMKGLRPGSLT